MVIGIPQSLLLTWYFVIAALSIVKHGEPKIEKPNAFQATFFTLLELFILHLGGFFINVGFCQVLYAFLAITGLTMSFVNHGKASVVKHHGGIAVASLGFILTIYYVGGFFG